MTMPSSQAMSETVNTTPESAADDGDTNNVTVDGAVVSCITKKRHQQGKLYRLTIFECSMWMLSIVMYIADFVTDFVVGFSYIIDGHPIWGTMIILLSIASAIVVQAFSLYWSYGCCWRQSLSIDSNNTEGSYQPDDDQSETNYSQQDIVQPDQHGRFFKICHFFGLSMLQR